MPPRLPSPLMLKPVIATTVETLVATKLKPNLATTVEPTPIPKALMTPVIATTVETLLR